MKIRLHVEDFEIEIGGSDKPPSQLAQIFASSMVPIVHLWLERNASRLWPKPPPVAAAEDDDDAGEPSRHVVDGAAAPSNGTPAAEV
jgi:hypothetical protein